MDSGFNTLQQFEGDLSLGLQHPSMAQGTQPSPLGLAEAGSGYQTSEIGVSSIGDS